MDYVKMTVSQLRGIAKEKGIAHATSLKKQELLDALAGLESEEKENPITVKNDETAEKQR